MVVRSGKEGCLWVVVWRKGGGSGGATRRRAHLCVQPRAWCSQFTTINSQVAWCRARTSTRPVQGQASAPPSKSSSAPQRMVRVLIMLCRGRHGVGRKLLMSTLHVGQETSALSLRQLLQNAWPLGQPVTASRATHEHTLHTKNSFTGSTKSSTGCPCLGTGAGKDL